MRERLQIIFQPDSLSLISSVIGLTRAFLEEGDVIFNRLQKCIELFGEENIPYAGPECGWSGSLPTSRISSAIKNQRTTASKSTVASCFIEATRPSANRF